MQKSGRISAIKVALFFMLILGMLLVAISIFDVSSFLAILGIAIIFWGGTFLYITPTKTVSLNLLNAAIISATYNIERALAETNLCEKGRYLPPNFMKDFESSIVFIPEMPGQSLPKVEDIPEERLLLRSRNSVFITPPGLALSKLFEEQAGKSFTKKDLDFVQQKLPKILVGDLDLAQAADLQIQNDTVTLKLRGSVLRTICAETKNLPRTHRQVGCLLSSAVACVLAKASGKVVTIQKDELTEDEVTKIEFLLEPADKYTTETASSEGEREVTFDSGKQLGKPLETTKQTGT